MNSKEAGEELESSTVKEESARIGIVQDEKKSEREDEKKVERDQFG